MHGDRVANLGGMVRGRAGTEVSGVSLLPQGGAEQHQGLAFRAQFGRADREVGAAGDENSVHVLGVRATGLSE